MEQQNGSGRGFLRVAVYTAGNALPVEGATVTVQGVTEEGAVFVRTVTTDQSGRTPPLPLPTAAAALSLAPGKAPPYRVYDILVSRQGYYVHENLSAPIFANVTAIQPVELIPLPSYDVSGGAPRDSLLFSSEQALDGEVS